MTGEKYYYRVIHRGGEKEEITGYGTLIKLQELIPRTLFEYLLHLEQQGRLNQLKLIHEACICILGKKQKKEKKPAAKIQKSKQS